MAYLNLASIRECTESEGPGKRFALWCQGCLKRCRNCCNAEMQEIRNNIIVDTADVIELIRKAKENFGIEGVSFIGGEPVLQAKGLSIIASWCKQNDLSVLIFSGYAYEELSSMKDSSIGDLLKNTDILVDGPFIDELLDNDREWVGSSNQRVLLLTNRYKPGIECEKNERTMEMLISDKEFLINGWPF